MNKIEKLINELCPNGVEFKELGEVCEIKTGRLNANAMVEKGEYPFFTCAEKPFKIDNYAFDTEAILISGNGSQVGHVNYYKGKFNAYQRTYVLDNFKDINVFFLLHFLKGNLRKYIFEISKKGSVPYITLPLLKTFKIPLPPLDIQKEIVKILDNFTKLEAELEAELEARMKQYEYYRDKLLSFDDDEVEWKELGKVAEVIGGSGLSKSDFTESGVNCIHYGQIYTYYGVHTTKTISFVSEDLASRLKKVKKGDIIIAKTSENIEDLCKTVAYLGDNEIVTGGHTAILKHNQNPKYLSYYINFSEKFEKEKRKIATGIKVLDISLKNLKKIKIPIPPLEKQKEIVEILDKFDKLVNDISEGLPAEIEARRKQYEYYRGKLLEFEEKK